MKVKTNKLSGGQLDYAVSLVTNPDWSDRDRMMNTLDYMDSGDPEDTPYDPSSNPAIAGKLMVEYTMDVVRTALIAGSYRYKATIDLDEGDGMVASAVGSTHWEAVCRAVVLCELGEEVDVPEKPVNLYALSDAIKKEYLTSGCQAADVDAAVIRLETECPGLFASADHAWSFLMEELHENLEEDESVLAIGDEVFWNDPDRGISSGYYKVVEIMSEDAEILADTIICLKNESGSYAEVFMHEIDRR